MRKILIAGIIFHAASANALDIAYLVSKKHFPIMNLEVAAGTLCQSEFSLMSINPDSSGISQYENCVTKTKKNFSDAFIGANKYLKDKGYNDAALSLRKYYNSALEMLSTPALLSRESRHENILRNSREQKLKSAIDAAWQELETDIKIADQ